MEEENLIEYIVTLRIKMNPNFHNESDFPDSEDFNWGNRLDIDSCEVISLQRIDPPNLNRENQ